MTTTFRAFYALAIDESLRSAASDAIQQMRQQDWGNKVRWVKAENLHITLRFVGDVTEETTGSINDMLESSLRDVNAFTLCFNGIDIFPSPKKPRAIVALMDKNEPLMDLRDKVESAAIRAGLTAENRQFKAHLTLGRCKDSFPRRTNLTLPQMSNKLPVARLVLFKSELAPQGSIYTALREFTLPP